MGYIMGTADAFFHIGWNQWTVVTHEGGQQAYCTYPNEVSAKAAADSYNERANPCLSLGPKPHPKFSKPNCTTSIFSMNISILPKVHI